MPTSLVKTVLSGIGLAMGVAVIVLGILDSSAPSSLLILVGIGVAALGLANLQR